MNRRLALLTAASTILTGGIAFAQGAPREEVTIGYQGLPSKPSGESPNGIQLSDGVLMHVGAGAEGGYDTNVFYASSSENPVGSPMLRSTIFTSIGNATRGGAVSRQLTFDARAGLTYRRYQGDDASLDRFRNAWMPSAGLALGIGSGQVGFGFADTFVRLEDPPYSSGQDPITRYNNQASAEVRWSPGGGRLTGVLRYTNMLDFIQGTFSYATSMLNQIMLDGSWRWLPKTAIFLNATQGFISYLDDNAEANNKFPSYPLRITTGLRGLLTEKTSAVVAVGYVNGFYSGQALATTSGFLGSTFAEVALTVRPTLLSRAILGYRHDFTNSVIASFSYDETVYASYVQQIASRLSLDLSGRYVHRDFQGFTTGTLDAMGNPVVVPRTDNFFQVGASLDYFVRNWMYAGVGYAVLANDSNVPATAGALAVNYVKQQILARLGITY
jgi:hypothetical protein